MIITSNPPSESRLADQPSDQMKTIVNSLHSITEHYTSKIKTIQYIVTRNTNPILSVVLLFNQPNQSDQTDWCRWSWNLINISTSVITFSASSIHSSWSSLNTNTVSKSKFGTQTSQVGTINQWKSQENKSNLVSQLLGTNCFCFHIPCCRLKSVGE